jgi:glycosyltransferase involved in cell wall biosynthesis
MPQATVLIPTYNCGKFIKQALESVLQQPYTDYELIVVDDGSTDETEKVVKSIIDSRIIYIKNPQNLGISAASNIGLNLAKGKYIARMDADDIIIGNRLSDQIAFLESNPKYGMVGGWYKMMDEKGFIIREVKPLTNNIDLQPALLFRNQFAQSAVTMRSDIAKRLMYNESLPNCEDHDLWIRIAKESKIANLPEYYLQYRWHKNNTCNTHQKSLQQSLISIYSKELTNFKIKHTAHQLMLHAAVSFGVTLQILKTKEQYTDLKDWHNKIFSSKLFIKRFENCNLDNFRLNILEQQFLNTCISTNDEAQVPKLDSSIQGNYTISKDNLPRISIITVVFNMVDTIKQTIDSVLAQDYPNLEYIIIDGGSTDGTLELINKYKDKIACIISEPDNGIADAFNKGIRKATGSIIGLINADDWLESTAIDDLVLCYVENPYYDVYYGQCNIVLPNKINCTPKPNAHAFLTHTMSISHPSVFVSYNSYIRYGLFSTTYKIAMDYDLLLRFMCLGASFKFINKVLVNVGYGGVSQRHRNIAEQESSLIRQNIYKKIFSDR